MINIHIKDYDGVTDFGVGENNDSVNIIREATQ